MSDAFGGNEKKTEDSYLSINNIFIDIEQLINQYRKHYDEQEIYSPNELMNIIIGNFGVDLEHLINNFAEKNKASSEYRIDIDWKKTFKYR